MRSHGAYPGLTSTCHWCALRHPDLPGELFHARDDTMADAENSVGMYLALKRVGIAAELHEAGAGNALATREHPPRPSAEATEGTGRRGNAMSTPLRGILVGLGGRAHHWYTAVQRHPETEYVAYVEPAEASRQRAIERWGVTADRIFSSLEEAAGQAQADFAVDVTPPAAHEAVAAAAFKAGLHLIGEKPISIDFQTRP